MEVLTTIRKKILTIEVLTPKSKRKTEQVKSTLILRKDHQGNRGLGPVHVQLYNMKFLKLSFQSFASISVRFCVLFAEI